jgi:hypothetical protein
VEEDISTETAVSVELRSATPGDVYGVAPRGAHVVPAARDGERGARGWTPGTFPRAVAALFAWVGKNGYSSNDPTGEVHHFVRELDHQDLGPGSLVIEGLRCGSRSKGSRAEVLDCGVAGASSHLGRGQDRLILRVPLPKD